MQIPVRQVTRSDVATAPVTGGLGGTGTTRPRSVTGFGVHGELNGTASENRGVCLL
jgi:hypothetical protein